MLKILKERVHKTNDKIIDEKSSLIAKTASKIYANLPLMKYFREIVSTYVLEKLKFQFQWALSYKVSEMQLNELQEKQWFLEIKIIISLNYYLYIFRKVEYHGQEITGKEHIVRLLINSQVLLCDCHYSTFCGYACRHELSIIIKQSLPFNSSYIHNQSNRTQ